MNRVPHFFFYMVIGWLGNRSAPMGVRYLEWFCSGAALAVVVLLLFLLRTVVLLRRPCLNVRFFAIGWIIFSSEFVEHSFIMLSATSSAPSYSHPFM